MSPEPVITAIFTVFWATQSWLSGIWVVRPALTVTGVSCWKAPRAAWTVQLPAGTARSWKLPSAAEVVVRCTGLPLQSVASRVTVAPPTQVCWSVAQTRPVTAP